MPSDFSFRLSTYLSLALACGCLGYAEADLLPSGAVIAGLLIGLLEAGIIKAMPDMTKLADTQFIK